MWEHIGCGKLLLRAVCSAVLGASAPSEGGEGWGHIVAAGRLQLVCLYYNWLNLLIYKKHSVPVPASELIKFNGDFWLIVKNNSVKFF